MSDTRRDVVPVRLALREPPWLQLMLGWMLAYAAGIALGLGIMALGWWLDGGAWERAMLVAAQTTVSPAMDAIMLVLPLFGTNYTLVPVVLLAALWLWRPPGRPGTVLLGLVAALVAAGAVRMIGAFVLGGGVPLILMLVAAAAAATLAVRLDARHADRPHRPVPALHLLLVQLGSWTLNPALKFSLMRPRPDLFELRGQFDFPAFPSGHSIAVTSVMFTAAYLLHRYGKGTWGYWVVGAFFLLNSYSRVYLGVHWPTDVIGGTVVGLVWLFAGIRAFRGAHG